MSTQTYSHHRHHIYTLEDCRLLLEAMGFHYSEELSYEDDHEAVAISVETQVSSRPIGQVQLLKNIGQLVCTDHYKEGERR